jgi:hypothetical protein
MEVELNAVALLDQVFDSAVVVLGRRAAGNKQSGVGQGRALKGLNQMGDVLIRADAAKK